MIGTSQNQPHAKNPKRNETRIHDSNAALVRDIQIVSGMDCFATDLSYVCPDIYCRWRDDCLGLNPAGFVASVKGLIGIGPLNNWLQL